MALVTCVNCGKGFSDSVGVCPHCGFVPKMRICPECGNICGLTSNGCNACGYQLTASPFIHATDEKVEQAYCDAVDELASASDRRDWEKLKVRFLEFGQYKEAEQYAGKCAAEVQYIESVAQMQGAGTSDEWRSLRNIFLSLESFLNTEDKVFACNEKLKEALYQEAIALEEATPVDINHLADIYAELGEYKDAETRLEKCREQLNAKLAKKKRKTKLLVAGICAVVALAAFAVFCITWLHPYLRYQSAEDAFANGDFALAQEQYIAAGDFEDAAAKAVLANKAMHYSNAEQAFSNGDYILAHDEFILAGDYEDAENRAAESILANHYALGLATLSEKNYDIAIQEFVRADGYSDSADKINEAYYCMGGELLQAKKYDEAAEVYHNSNGYGDASVKLMEVGKALLDSKKYADAAEAFSWSNEKDALDYTNYAKGMDSFSNKEYADARTIFTKTNAENAAQMVMACDLMLAEESLKAGDLNAALKKYKALPEDFEYGNVNVSQRLGLLNKYSSFVAICGKYNASKNYIETRNVYKRTGSWDSWYYDNSNVLPGELTIRCIPNDDGTMTITGTVSFYRFTDYSSLSAYCDVTNTTKKFTIKGVTSIPSSSSIDSNTTLKYTNGEFSISYSVQDNYSAYFYNVYSSSVTYGKKGIRY